MNSDHQTTLDTIQRKYAVNPEVSAILLGTISLAAYSGEPAKTMSTEDFIRRFRELTAPIKAHSGIYSDVKAATLAALNIIQQRLTEGTHGN